MSLKQTFKAAYLARSFWIDIKTYHLHCLHTGDLSAIFHAVGFFNEADTLESSSKVSYSHLKWVYIHNVSRMPHKLNGN